jgi:DNA primase
MISQESIEEIKQRASLLEIIGEVVSLRRSGSSYTGLCPFHSERSPSFHVRDEQGYFHCFGCGQSGNVFKFLMETKGISFPEAVQELAQRYGIILKENEGPQRKPKSNDDQSMIYRINDFSHRFFIDALSKAPQLVKSYLLEERGITPESITRFGIGFAPNGWNALSSALVKKGAAEEKLTLSGISRRSDKGELYDTFRSRITFPVWLDHKKIAGFGGRIIPALTDPNKDHAPPKYLNSPESPVYQKSKILYGLPQALPTVREVGNIYVVEGYLDVVGFAQAGILETVATCGTALTELHVKRLRSLTKKVTFLFDGDSAGRAAAGKSFPTFLNSGLDVDVLFLPPEEDPDSFAKKFKGETKQALSSIAPRNLFECHIEYLLDQRGIPSVSELGAAQRGALAEEVATLLSFITNPIEHGEYLDRASVVLRVDRKLFAEMRVKAKSSSSVEIATTHREDSHDPYDDHAEEEPSQQMVQLNALPKVDQEILLAAMASKERIPERILKSSDLAQSLHGATLSFIESLAKLMRNEALDDAAKKQETKELLERYGQSWTAHWKKAFTMSRDASIDIEQMVTDIERSLVKERLKKMGRDLEKGAQLSKDEDEKLKMSLEVIKIKKLLSAAP